MFYSITPRLLGAGNLGQAFESAALPMVTDFPLLPLGIQGEGVSWGFSKKNFSPFIPPVSEFRDFKKLSLLEFQRGAEIPISLNSESCSTHIPQMLFAKTAVALLN